MIQRNPLFLLFGLFIVLHPSQLDALCAPPAIELGSGCGEISFEGCCAADMVMWCETTTDTICAQICSTNTDGNATCGWKTLSYECTPTQTPDPSGQHPLICGSVPSEGSCLEVGLKGCCTQADVLNFCDNGTVSTIACAANSSPQSSKCGWNQTLGFYDCVGSNIEDPTGTYPFYCEGEDPNPGCEPQCGNKQCGDDSCGGSCGSCTGAYVCNNGYCVPPTCAPSCEGKECGPDGCGASCGDCAAGINCSTAGQCIDNCTPNCSGKQCGGDGCGGNCGQCPTGMSCSAQQICSGSCLPNCVEFNKQCGEDGCGGSCGACGVSLECNAGFQCVPCASSCTGKQCGNDGCGGVCGYCPAGKVCSGYGFCILEGCTPYCAGKQCGEDGCGGQCGVCLNGAVCSQGLCVGGTVPPTTDTTDTQCPPGQVLQYGECVFPTPGPAPVAGDSGCQQGKAPGTSPWFVFLCALGLLTFRRRQNPKF